MKKNLLFLVVLSVILFNSCFVSKKVVYFDDMKVDSVYQAMRAPVIKIQKSDRISIQVSAKRPELALPFNQAGSIYNIDEKGVLGASNAASVERGYLVDQSGNIDFPILGLLKVEGMTLEEVKEMLQLNLTQQNFIDAPIVRVELMNLKVMVMGEVAAVGVLDVQDAKITLLEAITRSGGLTVNATADDILVIREEQGVRKLYSNNIKEEKFFMSPSYYLQQNDIVYVKPKSAVSTPREDMSWRYVSMFTGFATMLISLFVLLR